MERLDLASLRDALTWHTLIEVFAIIVTGFIVHPMIGLTKNLWQSFQQRVARSSQKRAIKRVIRLCARYQRILVLKEGYQSHLSVTILTTSTENLAVYQTYALAIVVSCIPIRVSFLAGIAIFLYGALLYLNIVNTRVRIVDFDGFKRSTQDQMLDLKKIVQNDGWLAEMWEARFGEKPPFAVPADGRMPYSPPVLKD